MSLIESIKEIFTPSLTSTAPTSTTSPTTTTVPSTITLDFYFVGYNNTTDKYYGYKYPISKYNISGYITYKNSAISGSFYFYDGLAINTNGTYKFEGIPAGSTCYLFINSIYSWGGDQIGCYAVPSYYYAGTNIFCYNAITSTDYPINFGSSNTIPTYVTLAPNIAGWKIADTFQFTNFIGTTLVPINDDNYYLYSITNDELDADIQYNRTGEWVNANTKPLKWVQLKNLYFKSYVNIPFDNYTYYDGFRYVLYHGDTNSILADDWSYNDSRNTMSSSVYSAYFTLTDSSQLTTKSYAQVIPYAYTRFKYPADVANRHIKCINIASYFTNADSAWVQNGNINIKDAESTASGTTYIMTSMPNKYVVYGASSYIKATVIDSGSVADNKNYISNIVITAYNNNGNSMVGTKTGTSGIKYPFSQQDSAYTFAVNITTRLPKIYIRKNSSQNYPYGATFSFNGGASANKSILLNSVNSNVDMTSRIGDVILTGITLPDASAYLKVSEITVKTYNAAGTSAISNTYTWTGASKTIATDPQYDIYITPNCTANDKKTGYLLPGNKINGSYLQYNLSYTTAATYNNTIASNTTGGSSFFNCYVTSLTINSITLVPAAKNYAYIQKVDVLTADSTGAELSTLATITDPTSSHTILTNNSTNIADNTILQICPTISTYTFPIKITSDSNKTFKSQINNNVVSVSNPTSQYVADSISYCDTITVNYISMDAAYSSYEAKTFNFICYGWTNAAHSYYEWKFDIKNLTIGTPYTLYTLNGQSITPYSECIITPNFTVTEAPKAVNIVATAAQTTGVDYYTIKVGDTVKVVSGTSDTTVTTMDAGSYLILSTIQPNVRYKYLEANRSNILYTDSTSKTYSTTFSEGTKIIKPSTLTGTLTGVLITPSWASFTTYNVSFNIPSGDYSSYKYNIQYYDSDGQVSSISNMTGAGTTDIDTLVPSHYTFTLKSVDVSNSGSTAYVKSVIEYYNGSVVGTYTLPRTANVSNYLKYEPVVEFYSKLIYINLYGYSNSDYVLYYKVNDGLIQNVTVLKGSGAKAATVNFYTTDTVTITKVEFTEKQFVINSTNGSITVDGVKKSIGVAYKYTPSSATYVNLSVNPVVNWSNVTFKLRVDTEDWTENLGDNSKFKYNIQFNESNWVFDTDSTLLPNGFSNLCKSYVTVDSYIYRNVNTAVLDAKYTGTEELKAPPVNLSFLVKDTSYFYVKDNYISYKATYNTDDASSSTYNWAAPADEAFAKNSQLQISYIIAVSANTYDFRGSIVPYDMANNAYNTNKSTVFTVSAGNTATYTLATPKDAGIAYDKYGVVLSKTQVNVANNWVNCKYKLSLKPTVVPSVTQYNTFSIINNNTRYTPAPYSVTVSLKQGTLNPTPVNGAILNSNGASVQVKYNQDRSAPLYVNISISTVTPNKSLMSFKLVDNNGTQIATTTSGQLDTTQTVSTDSTMAPTLLIQSL